LGTPGRYFFAFLSCYAKNELEQDKLRELSEAEFMIDFYKYCVKEKRSYAEVLMEFPSARPPLEQLISVIPRLQPRLFSIASSPLAQPDNIRILLAVLEFKTAYKRDRIGVCSQYMRSLQAGDAVQIWVKKGAFHFPAPAQITEKSVPFVFVGPGTGIAPFVAMAEQISYLRKPQQQQISRNNSNNSSGNGNGDANEPYPALVVFGNRNESKDYLVQDDWKRLTQEGSVLSVQCAWSRDSETKIYVQDIMQLPENAAIIAGVLQAGGYFMLAGHSKKMPMAVLKALKQIVRNQQGNAQMTDAQADAYLKQLQRSGKFQMETWG
jgi:sulfite reductase alpha subunit-like flavoprotein